MDRTLSSARPALRLIVQPTQDVRHAWYTRCAAEGRAFLLCRGHLLSDPSLTPWVIEQCAEFVWEWRGDEAPAWSHLRMREIWWRLDQLHRFFPLPRLVIAYYETLEAFLPWLAARGRLERGRGLALLEELEQARSSLLVRAREQLAARAIRGMQQRR